MIAGSAASHACPPSIGVSRTRPHRVVAVPILLLTLCAPALAQEPNATEVVDTTSAARDRAYTISGGSTFKAPADWSVTIEGPVATLEFPEGDSWMWIVETSASHPDSAVAAAWRTTHPEGDRAIRLASPQPGRDGWDEAKTYEYETSPNEQRLIAATAFRNDSTWTVAMIHADLGTVQKRGAQAWLVGQTLRPAGYVDESFAGRSAHPLDTERLALLTGFIETAVRELGIPGVGLGLIQDGEVVFEGGIGVRELGEPEPATADTRFLIASITKPLTTLLLARLVDEGRFAWDTHVLDVYPEFRLGDESTTRQVRMEHLVCACTGLPRQDAEWLLEFDGATPASAMALLGGMQPTSGFGELFQYSNHMAAAAGFIAGHVLHPDRELGAAYDEAMRTRVFEPLGMRDATFDFSQAERGDHARPHGYDVDGETRVASMAPNRSIGPVRPAGGLWTSVRDLLGYARMELAGGMLPDGSRLVSEENLLARREEKARIGETAHYGMGLGVDTEWDVTAFGHDGTMFGYRSQFWVLPEHGVAAVLLTNADNGWMLAGPFYRRLLEVLFDGEAEAEENLVASARDWRASVAEARTRLEVPADPAESAKLASRYRNPALGEIAVRRTDARTLFDFGEWASEVASRTNDDGTVSFLTIDPTMAGLELVVDGETLVFHDAQHEYIFVPE